MIFGKQQNAAPEPDVQQENPFREAALALVEMEREGELPEGFDLERRGGGTGKGADERKAHGAEGAAQKSAHRSRRIGDAGLYVHVERSVPYAGTAVSQRRKKRQTRADLRTERRNEFHEHNDQYGRYGIFQQAIL